MCNFFSFTTKGDGKTMYFDWELRQKIIAKKLNYEADSHTSINDYFGLKGADEDKTNKYEYNPLTKLFKVDQINVKDDSEEAERWAKTVDFKTIVEPLIIKKIIHPFKDIKQKKITQHHLKLLSSWTSVRNSVGDSVWASVRDSVWDSVGTRVWASVRDSVWDSMGTSVRASVWASVGCYVSSFFDIIYDYDFTPAIKLWEDGIVPSYDGNVWRLHTSEGILWTGKIINGKAVKKG